MLPVIGRADAVEMLGSTERKSGWGRLRWSR